MKIVMVQSDGTEVVLSDFRCIEYVFRGNCFAPQIRVRLDKVDMKFDPVDIRCFYFIYK